MTGAKTSRYALVFIFITIFVDVVGLGIIIPVAPKLISHLAHVGLSEAARYGGWLFFVYAGMQFLCAPIIGNLSDRFGRRPVLIYALISIGIDYAITGWAPTINWLFLGRFLSGMAGGSYTTASAYIADVSPPEKRAANFGLVGAAFGLGFTLGPPLGGFLGEYGVHLFGDAGTRLPFFVAAGLAFANALFGFFVLSESLPKESRREFEIWRANPLGSLIALRRFPYVLGLCIVIVFLRFRARRQSGDLDLLHDAQISLVDVAGQSVLNGGRFYHSPRLWRVDASGHPPHRRSARGLLWICCRRYRMPWLCFFDPRLDALWVDGRWIFDGPGHAGLERDHVEGGRPVRAGRIARRYRQYRKFHVDICAARDVLSLRVFHQREGSGLFPGRVVFRRGRVHRLGCGVVFARQTACHQRPRALPRCG